jgi:hypothetical protein
VVGYVCVVSGIDTCEVVYSAGGFLRLPAVKISVFCYSSGWMCGLVIGSGTFKKGCGCGGCRVYLLYGSFHAGGSTCCWRMSFGIAFGVLRVWWTAGLHWCVLSSRGYECCGGLEVGYRLFAPRAFLYGGFCMWSWSEMYCALLVGAWVCCRCWVAFVACPSFDRDELFYWAGMGEAVGVDPSEAAFTL